MNPVTFGQRLRAARKKAGYTQATLAVELRVSRETVARWETDEFAPSHPTRLALATILHEQPEFFADETPCAAKR